MSNVERAAKEATGWAIKATPLAALWLILGFMKSGRMRQSASEAAASDGWVVIILGGLGIIAAVFAGAFVLRLSGMRAPEELRVTDQQRIASRQRQLMKLMWILMAIAGIVILAGAR